MKAAADALEAHARTYPVVSGVTVGALAGNEQLSVLGRAASRCEEELLESKLAIALSARPENAEYLQLLNNVRAAAAGQTVSFDPKLCSLAN